MHQHFYNENTIPFIMILYRLEECLVTPEEVIKIAPIHFFSTIFL